ncbi:uronyl 2-sulfotransferase-like [Lytechinus pictus]|uniref:uronyl 2-sulfotransferase-like n=1 Tax=Lytechinus pictus TaxID=7653 RepID=UPI0030B9D346
MSYQLLPGKSLSFLGGYMKTERNCCSLRRFFLKRSMQMATCYTANRKLWLTIFVILAILSGLHLGMRSSMRWTDPYRLRHRIQIKDVREVVDDSTVEWDVLEADDECTEENIEEDELTSYGKPIYGKNKTVLYLSIPKTGTRTVVWALERLREVHHFGNLVPIDYLIENNITSEVNKYMTSKITESEDGAVLHGHYRYIDLSRSPKKLILMSMIRDPIDRFESHFYFLRHGDVTSDKEKLLKLFDRPDSKLALPNETLDDCVEKNRRDCTHDLFRHMYITAFCGYAPGCSESPSFAFNEAKRNVDKFLVIGVTEEYDLSMAVFEKLLPETFGGVAKIYEEGKSRPMTMFKTTYKKHPSDKTYSILKQRMKYEYQFYYYVKRRLHRVARKLGIWNCSNV